MSSCGGSSAKVNHTTLVKTFFAPFLIVAMYCGGTVVMCAATSAGEFDDYRTVRTAITTNVHPSRAGTTGLAGYLGVSLDADAKGRLLVTEVATASPAADAGVSSGDILLKLGGKAM